MTELGAHTGTLRLSVSTPDDTPDDVDHLRSLYAWLTVEESLRGAVTSRGAVPEPGSMGAALDVLTVAIGSGGVAAVLARSVTTWLIQRRADVTVTVTAEDGTRVEVDVRRARDPEALIRQVAALAERPGGVAEGADPPAEGPDPSAAPSGPPVDG
ncbi:MULTISPECIES: hypothetical protein [unclassified Streptomyces]|uniref:effector-associated constant component EACC1 n=1 Tax=unclassified Streptomyces TaxID=2593676 RepID=UPI00114D1B42|nr:MULTISPECIES: hypothetical protein [unclassified Streptomyces]MYZ36197.1 hypothetical protein [Streptomyces sp. SID4917]